MHTIASLILTAAAVSAPLTGDPAVTVNSANTYVSGIAFNLVEGWKFHTTQSLSVNALGVFDYGSDGLVQVHEVGLWDASQVLLATTTVPAGTAATLIDKFRYSSIATVALDADRDYYIAALYRPNPDLYIGASSGTSISTAPGVEWVSHARTISNSLAFPGTVHSGFSPGYFGPNFLLSPVAVPEPATWTLLATGMLILTVVARRRRRLHG